MAPNPRKTRDDVLYKFTSFGEERANLRQWNLTGVDLTELDLTDDDLTGANLENADLSHSDLRTVPLTDANLTGANLTSTHLAGAQYHPEQLLNTRGLNPTNNAHGIPQEVWGQILPKGPTYRAITVRLLQDWDGTLKEAITHSYTLAPKGPETRHLLRTLLQDWDGTVQEAIAAAETLHSA